MSSRYQKVLPQLTPSTSVLDTRSTTPDVTPALQFAQQLQTNLDELSVIKTPNHLAGDAEYVKRGYLDPINEAKNKAIEAFQGNNIAEGVQGLRDIKSFMLQSQQQGGVYSQIENNYNKAAEYTKQLEEGYTKGTYQDWQVNNYKGLINKSKSFNDAGEYVPFELSNPAQALDLPKYFNDLAKDWGKTAFSTYRLTSDGLFYDMSSGTRVTKEEVKAGLLQFMASDTKAQSYYKELASVFGEAAADSMFNNAMNAAADKEEFSQINPHYVRNPLIEAASSSSTRTNKDKDGKPILDGLLGKQVVIPGVGINMDEIPSKLFLYNGDLITPIGGTSGGYRSLITKEKVKVKDANLITSRDMDLAAKDAFVEQFKEYPASNNYTAVTLDKILTNDKFKTVKENLQRQAPGLLETARRFPVEEYRKSLAKGADYNGNDYNQFLLKKYQQLNDTKTGFFNMIQPMAKDNKLVVSRPNGETINYETFRDVEIPNLIANHGLSIIELVNGKGNPMDKKGLEKLKEAVDIDPKKIKILGTFQNEGAFNPFAGRYVIEIDNKQYVIPGDTESARRNGSLTNLALHSVFKNNGSSSPLGSPVGTTGSYTDSEYLFTTLFLANNPNIDDIPPIGGQFIVSMDDKYDKNNKLKNFNIDTYDPENSDVKIIYKAPNGTKYTIPQNMYNLSDLTNLGRYNDSYISDPTLYQTFNNYMLQLNQK
jgi:hypothetical protein